MKQPFRQQEDDARRRRQQEAQRRQEETRRRQQDERMRQMRQQQQETMRRGQEDLRRLQEDRRRRQKQKREEEQKADKARSSADLITGSRSRVIPPRGGRTLRDLENEAAREDQDDPVIPDEDSNFQILDTPLLRAQRRAMTPGFSYDETHPFKAFFTLILWLALTLLGSLIIGGAMGSVAALLVWLIGLVWTAKRANAAWHGD